MALLDMQKQRQQSEGIRKPLTALPPPQTNTAAGAGALTAAMLAGGFRASQSSVLPQPNDNHSLMSPQGGEGSMHLSTVLVNPLEDVVRPRTMQVVVVVVVGVVVVIVVVVVVAID